MKRTGLVFTGLVAVVALLAHCSSGDDSTATNPENAESSFNNPTGTVSNTNATDLMNEAIDAASNDAAGSAVQGLFKLSPRKLVQGLQKKGFLRKGQTTVADCLTNVVQDSQGNFVEATINVGCLSTLGELGSCTGSGTLTYRLEGNIEILTFNNFALDCGFGTDTCTGEFRYGLDSTNTLIECANATCTFADNTTETVDSCFRNGDILVTDDSSDTYVCLTLVPNTDCSTVSSDWTDDQGSLTITCDVTSKGTSCPPQATGIEAVGNCTVARN